MIGVYVSGRDRSSSILVWRGYYQTLTIPNAQLIVFVYAVNIIMDALTQDLHVHQDLAK